VLLVLGGSWHIFIFFCLLFYCREYRKILIIKVLHLRLLTTIFSGLLLFQHPLYLMQEPLAEQLWIENQLRTEANRLLAID
jgi:hypothetical protein